MSNLHNSIEKQLKKIQDKIREEVGEFVPFEKLFNLGFLDRNSDFGTIEELFAFHGIQVDSMEDFELLDEEVLDKVVSQSTKFASWEEMYKLAGQEYAIKKLKDAGFNLN